MVVFIPDISHHQQDINIQSIKNAGAAALIARVGQGAGRRMNGGTYGTTRDRKWMRNLAEAKRVGLTIVPYWYVGNLISPDENARLAKEWVGDQNLPWMIDHEDASGNISFYRRVISAFKNHGMRVVLGYLPEWYYMAIGRGDLSFGPPLVNSRYPSTTGGTPTAIWNRVREWGYEAWDSYGGQSVALWQFTNKASMAGQAIDMSAFRGTKQELLSLLGGAKEDDVSYGDAYKAISDYFGRKITNPREDAKKGVTTSLYTQLQFSDWRYVRTINAIKDLIKPLYDDETKATEAFAKIDTQLAELDGPINPEEYAQALAEALPSAVLFALREILQESSVPTEPE